MANISAYAPIVLFCYNRPKHLEQTLSSLAQNTLANCSTLYIYADGPKSLKHNRENFNESTAALSDEELRIKEVRQLIKAKRWQKSFKQVRIIEANENKGLAETVIKGVTQIVEQYNQVIVLEDDVLLNPYFLEFMNQALQLYQNEEAVGSIRAQVFELPNLPELFFTQMNGDFAWGTWQRVWQKVNFNGKQLLQELTQRKLSRKFDYENHYPYTQMLRDQIAGRNSSWGVRFYASLFLQDMLTLYPSKALAVHIGYDAGTHFKGELWSPLDGTLYLDKIPVYKIEVLESQQARTQMKRLFKQQGFTSFWLLRRILKKLLPYSAVGALKMLRQQLTIHRK